MDSGAATHEPPTVVLEHSEDSPMARLLQALMRDAASREPRLARRMRGSLALRTTDYPASATVCFEGSRLLVSAGVSAGARMVIEGESAALAALSAGDSGLRALRRSKVRLRGVARHPLFGLRVRRLLAPARPPP